MTDNGYLQMTINGLAGGQSFANLLYYAYEEGVEAPWTSALVGAFMTEWAEQYLTIWLAAMPEVYTLVSLVGRVVDTRGVVISDNAVEVPVAEVGLLLQTINGPFQTAIIRLPTVRAEAVGARAMKRSYLAFGPLGSTTMEEDGALVLGALGYLGDVADAISAQITVGVDVFVPIRVGRTAAPEDPAVGIVTDGIVDPFGSFRKSRKRRANGT